MEKLSITTSSNVATLKTQFKNSIWKKINMMWINQIWTSFVESPTKGTRPKTRISKNPSSTFIAFNEAPILQQKQNIKGNQQVLFNTQRSR